MNHLDIAVVRGAHSVLDGGRGEPLLEEMVHVAGKDCLELFLLLEPGNEVLGGLVCPLLDLAVTPLLSRGICLTRVILLGDLKGNPCEVGAVSVGSLQLRLAEFGSVKRYVAEHHDRKTFLHLLFHKFVLNRRPCRLLRCLR